MWKSRDNHARREKRKEKRFRHHAEWPRVADAVIDARSGSRRRWRRWHRLRGSEGDGREACRPGDASENRSLRSQGTRKVGRPAEGWMSKNLRKKSQVDKDTYKNDPAKGENSFSLHVMMIRRWLF